MSNVSLPDITKFNDVPLNFWLEQRHMVGLHKKFSLTKLTEAIDDWCVLKADNKLCKIFQVSGQRYVKKNLC